MKQSKIQLQKAQELYRRDHPRCWRPVMVNGLWVFCFREAAHAHHIAGRGMGKEGSENKFPLCAYPTGSCHLGWAHGESINVEPQGVARVRMFTVKVAMGEIETPDILRLMNGRNWAVGELAYCPDVAAAVWLLMYRMDSLWGSDHFKYERRRMAQLRAGQSF